MRPVCSVCIRAEARYTCPRCQAAYCSLDCYQAHGSKCTESFYKSQVEEELRSHKVSDEEKRHLEKVMASLARLDAASDDEDEDVYLTRQAQSLSLGWLEVLVYPGSLAFSWEGVGISLTLAGLCYGFQPLRMVLFALCYGQVLNRILKLVFQRERPVPPDNVKRMFRTIIITDTHADGASFPSGDTMAGSVTGASLALAGCGSGWWLLGLYAAVVATMKGYFLAHHWLDVIAGYAEGCAVSLLAAKVIRMHQETFDAKQLMGLLAAGVGLGMAMKLTKRIYSGPAKTSHLASFTGLGLRGEAEDEGDASEKRLEMLAELAASGELRLEDLTEEEAESFRVALKSGDLGRALGAWEPWWQKAAAVDLLSLDEDDVSGLEGDESLHQDPPRHLCCSADGSRQAHPSVAFTVLEALFAYVHTLRAFNGDWRWDPLQAAAHMFHLGKGIWAHQVHESATSTLQALWQLASKLPGGGFGANFDRHCVGDVATILSRGVGSCARALHAAEEGQARGAARLRRGVKKLDFLTSFAWHHPEALGADLAAQVQALEEVLQGYGQRLEDVSKRHSARTDGIALPERS
eukprot:s1344_g4.t1